MTREQLDAIRARADTDPKVGEACFDSEGNIGTVIKESDRRVLLAEVERLNEICAAQNATMIDALCAETEAEAKVERLTAEVEAKTTQSVALMGMNGRLQQEVERLTAELHRMKSRPVEAEFSRLDTMWQHLVRERDEAVHELRRLKGDRSEVNTAKLNDAFTEGTLKAGDAMRPLIADAFKRGVAAMREAAVDACRPEYPDAVRRLRALPDPEDTP